MQTGTVKAAHGIDSQCPIKRACVSVMWYWRTGFGICANLARSCAFNWPAEWRSMNPVVPSLIKEIVMKLACSGVEWKVLTPEDDPGGTPETCFGLMLLKWSTEKLFSFCVKALADTVAYYDFFLCSLIFGGIFKSQVYFRPLTQASL